MITIIGGGLAGCEAAWQAASRGLAVTLHEMRPLGATEVHRTDRLAELVCSNSLRSDKLDNAVGLLKEEMRRLGSIVMRAADATRVPAGAALAVDRDRFALSVTEAIEGHPGIAVVRGEVTAIPAASASDPVVIATGPLTSAPLAADLARLVGQEFLYFYDAVSPIVSAETIDRGRVFRASRWGRSLGATRGGASGAGGDSLGGAGGDGAHGAGGDGAHGAGGDGAPGGAEEGDYLNCPFTREEYERFHEALVAAETATVHDLDRERFFEGCLPIEVMARRGPDTLRFGPMKPVGLVDPATGRQPWAVVQLRQDNLAAEHFSLVGFQTQLKWGAQASVLRLIPGLERAEFVRFGMVHRNTYINAPSALDATWQMRDRPGLWVAGQVSGVEGYVESAASGLVAGIAAAALARGGDAGAPPPSTAVGALGRYVSQADRRHYQPSNVTFGIMEPLATPDRRLRRDRVARNLALSARALEALAGWAARLP